ncbi:MAG TPA: LysM peptidoglycan-binding domain-containing protein [Anaerolineales bacterium]|nr:LysM peptidoglycan-binding domain-containing protein [Anaerolineales bacterium]
MKALHQMGSGFIIGTISLLLVIGGISLSLAETSAQPLQPTPSPIPTSFAVEFASPLPSPTLPPAIPTYVPTLMPSATIAQAQATSVCIVPSNWIPITVSANDTLYSIAERYNTTVEELNQKNCLNLRNPAPGMLLYVPAVPTKAVVPCGPPAGWVKRHVIQPGENLFRIALSYGITYPQLQAGNCMGKSTTIFVGQVLWVPNVPTLTPTITITSTTDFSTPTHTATNTPDFSTPTSTFIVTLSPVPTATKTATQTLIPFPSKTPSQ